MRVLVVVGWTLVVCGCAMGEAPRRTALADAAARGDLLALRELLGRGTPVDEIDGLGFTALVHAARYGQLEALDVLAGAGADLDRRSGRNGWTPLQHAIHKNQHRAVARLVRLGADPDRGTHSGVTPLMMAAGYGHTPTVRLLLELGCDASRVSEGGVSALTLAVTGVPDIDAFTLGRCQTSTVRALVDHDPRLREHTRTLPPAVRLYVNLHCRDVARLLRP